MRIIWLEYLVLFVVGNGLGSFLNVVIHRIPRGESIVTPGSHCPKCDRPIKPWENIPVLSYVFLRGECAGCHSKISFRYPAVEIAMGGLLMLMLWKFGWTKELIIYGVMSAILLALTVIDIDTYRLPNKITYTGAIIAVVLTIILRWDYWIMSILGGFVGIGLLMFMGFIGQLLFKKEALGMGDVKFAGMIGLFVGPAHVGGMFVLSVFAGAFFSGVMMLFGTKKWGQKIPFGPYLATGSLLSLFWGKELWLWYISLAFR